MTILDRRRQLQQQIAQLPDDQLTQVERYLAFLGFQKTLSSQSEVTKSPSTGASILASLEQAHTPPDSPLEDDILAQPPEDFAAKIAEIKQRGDRSQSVIRRGSTGQDLLKFAGTWHGALKIWRVIFESSNKSQVRNACGVKGERAIP